MARRRRPGRRPGRPGRPGPGRNQQTGETSPPLGAGAVGPIGMDPGYGGATLPRGPGAQVIPPAGIPGDMGGGALAQGFPVGTGGSHIALDTTSQYGDKLVDTQKVTAGYFTGGGGILYAADLYTGSLAASNEAYYFNVTQTHPLSASAATQFSVAYGHKGGSGSNTQGDTAEGPTEAIYEQWAVTLLGENEVTGGFQISKGGTSGVHYSSGNRDEDIYILVGKRANFKDRLNKRNWTMILSGSKTAFGTAAGTAHTGSTTGANKIKLTDDSNTNAGTATVAGTRYNIVSGSDGSVTTAGSTRTYGWFYPEMGVMIFSAAELSSSIPGVGKTSEVTASFSKEATHTASGSNHLSVINTSMVASSSGFAPNLTNGGNAQNALRFVNCLQPNGTYMKFRSEEDQVSVSYFCRVKSQQMNFSNNPTFVSGSFNELIHRSMWGNPTVYVTGVGLYNAQGQLVAISKLSTPLQKNFASEATIKVKLTY